MPAMSTPVAAPSDPIRIGTVAEASNPARDSDAALEAFNLGGTRLLSDISPLTGCAAELACQGNPFEMGATIDAAHTAPRLESWQLAAAAPGDPQTPVSALEWAGIVLSVIAFGALAWSRRPRLGKPCRGDSDARRLGGPYGYRHRPKRIQRATPSRARPPPQAAEPQSPWATPWSAAHRPTVPAHL